MVVKFIIVIIISSSSSRSIVKSLLLIIYRIALVAEVGFAVSVVMIIRLYE